MAKVAVDTLLLCNLNLFPRHGREETQQCTVGAEESAEGTTREYRNYEQQNTEHQQLHITTQTENTDKGIKLAHEESTACYCIQNSEYQVEPR